MAALDPAFRVNFSDENAVMNLAYQILSQLAGISYEAQSPDNKVYWLEQLSVLHLKITQVLLKRAGVSAPAATAAAPQAAAASAQSVSAGDDLNTSRQVITTKGNVADFASYQIDPAKDYFNKFQPQCTTILNSEIAAMKRCMELLQGTQKFTDPDFNPDVNGPNLLYSSGQPPAAGYTDPANVEWKRPEEWAPNAKFFSGGISSNDVEQGALGDCWFIGALSTLATRDELLTGSIKCLSNPNMIKTPADVAGLSKGVYPPIFHPFAKKNLYVLRFFQSSGWRYVIIDDRLPTHKGRHALVFAHCHDRSELWVPLIEKAYAKLFGCYEALNSGLIDDALVDMTGLVAEKTKLKGVAGNQQKINEIWDTIFKYRQNKTLMGCSIEGSTEGEVRWDGERTGLLSGHAYSLVDALRFEEQSGPNGCYRLLRVRNPWGRMEWTGPWSNGSDELQDFSDGVMREVSKLGPDEAFDVNDRNDGTFLMEIMDWSEIYHNLFACVDFPDQWSGVRFASEWTKQNSGGVPKGPNDFKKWATNPQVVIDLKAPAEVFISLQQEDGRLVKGSKFPYAGHIKAACFAVTKLEANEGRCAQFDQRKVLGLSTVKPHREVAKRFNLQPGRYAIVPATMNAGETGIFTIALYYSVPKAQIDHFSGENPSYKGDVIKEEEEVRTGRTNPDMNGIKSLVGRLCSL